MAGFYSTLKKAALNWLPKPVLQYAKKVHYEKELRAFSMDDDRNLRIVRFLVEPGDHVIDIGANVGFYTKGLSDLVGSEGHVYCVEPLPPTFDILSRNVRKLNLSNVTPFNRAVSDKIETVTMELPQFETGGDNYYEARVIGPDGAKSGTKLMTVQTTTVDAEFANTPVPVSFVKCDTEGHELNVLRGATKFLDRSLPIWVIEVEGNPDEKDSKAHELFKILAARGYSPYLGIESQLKKRNEGERKTDFFFLTEDHVHTLEKRHPDLFLPQDHRV